jgi:DNA-binding beta-propeller fold protein YncE
VLFSPYAAAILFTLEDFPASRDVLFDPNEVDIYFSNSADGTIGLIDTNTKRTFEVEVADSAGQDLSAPSRSLDGRYIYVANNDTGEVYSLNAFSKVIYRTFNIGNSPARPYTTPEGAFLYMMDKDTGRFLSIDQHRFEPYEDVVIGEGIDLVTVGRFDRMNLMVSSENKNFYVYDNVRRSVIESGQFLHTPLDTQGSADGRTAYVAFQDSPSIAIIDLENHSIKYITAGINGIGAFGIGLSNNVCH